MADIDRWYVVATYSGAEWDAHRAILSRGIDSLLPFSIASTRRGRWSRGVVRPYFPGYLFAGLEPGQEGDNIERIPAVREIVRNSGKYVRLTPLSIEELRRQAAEVLDHSLGERVVTRTWQVGDWCAVPYGPLAGKPAQIEGIDKAGMVRVSLGNIAATFHVSALGGYSVPASA